MWKSYRSLLRFNLSSGLLSRTGRGVRRVVSVSDGCYGPVPITFGHWSEPGRGLKWSISRSRRVSRCLPNCAVVNSSEQTCSVEEAMFAIRQPDMLSRSVRSRLSELMQNRLVYFIIGFFLHMFDVFQGVFGDCDGAFINMDIYVFFCGFVSTRGLKDRY